MVDDYKFHSAAREKRRIVHMQELHTLEFLVERNSCLAWQFKWRKLTTHHLLLFLWISTQQWPDLDPLDCSVLAKRSETWWKEENKHQQHLFCSDISWQLHRKCGTKKNSWQLATYRRDGADNRSHQVKDRDVSCAVAEGQHVCVGTPHNPAPLRVRIPLHGTTSNHRCVLVFGIPATTSICLSLSSWETMWMDIFVKNPHLSIWVWALGSGFDAVRNWTEFCS